jgi:hypothetical protein
LKKHGTIANFLRQPKEMLRNELLEMHGIGPETADSIVLRARDIRSGIRFKTPFSGNFPSSFQPLHRGMNQNSTIQFNRSFSNCLVSKGPSGNFAPCTGFSGNQIADSFNPYGVNIYKLS